MKKTINNSMNLLFTVTDIETGLESVVYQDPDGRYRVIFRDSEDNAIYTIRIYRELESARIAAHEFAHAHLH